jgi:hypothetical protein
VTQAPPSNRLRALMWFGLLGPPIAFVVQFVLGYGVTEAACGPSAVKPSIDTWTIALMAFAVGVGVLGMIAAVSVFRALRGQELDGPPPRGRVYFLSIIAMTTTPLFLFIIVMSSTGVLVLEKCHQS